MLWAGQQVWAGWCAISPVVRGPSWALLGRWVATSLVYPCPELMSVVVFPNVCGCVSILENNIHSVPDRRCILGAWCGVGCHVDHIGSGTPRSSWSTWSCLPADTWWGALLLFVARWPSPLELLWLWLVSRFTVTILRGMRRLYSRYWLRWSAWLDL